MWSELWTQIRDAKKDIYADDAHGEDDRSGRYQRALMNLGQFLAKGSPIAYRHFETDGSYDVCYLVGWYEEEYFESGQYYVFKMFYTKKNDASSMIGYRGFVYAEICAYYDGEYPDPGKTMRSRQEALEYTKRKGGYYEAK